jgi:hypothetical protein
MGLFWDAFNALFSSGAKKVADKEYGQGQTAYTTDEQKPAQPPIPEVTPTLGKNP